MSPDHWEGYTYERLPSERAYTFSIKINIQVTKNHRHLREVDCSLALPIDSSSYVHSHRYEALFGALCRASVLICPWIQHQACQLRPMSSLFLLDVYATNGITIVDMVTPNCILQKLNLLITSCVESVLARGYEQVTLLRSQLKV